MTDLISVTRHFTDVVNLAGTALTEARGIDEARGCVLSEEIRATQDIPLFTNSAMDGFAVRAQDVVPGERLAVVGDIAAGEIGQSELLPETAVRIMTGAPLPANADSVLPVEETENYTRNMLRTLPEYIVPTAVPKVGAHIRQAGSEIESGTPLYTAGTVLSPAHIGVLAALGYAQVPVFRKVRVGILATGSELHDPADASSPGKIPDSNSYMVAGLVEQIGADATRCGIYSDDVDSFDEAFARLVASSDLVITTGGVSAGAYDVVKAALQQRGIVFRKVRMQPGKPQGYGIVDGTPVLCLPGNPVSVFVSMQLFGLPLLKKMQGQPVAEFEDMLTEEVAGCAWKHKVGRTQFLPAKRTERGIEPVHTEHSSIRPTLTALPYADVLAVVPYDVEDISLGMRIQAINLRS